MGGPAGLGVRPPAAASSATGPLAAVSCPAGLPAGAPGSRVVSPGSPAAGGSPAAATPLPAGGVASSPSAARPSGRQIVCFLYNETSLFCVAK